MAGEAVGFSLVIDEALIKRMEKAQEMITSLATKSEQARTRIVDAFRDMGDKGVGHFIQKLHEAQVKINSLSGGNINIKATGLENISSQAAKGADDVNRLYEVITKLADANTKLVKQGKSLEKTTPTPSFVMPDMSKSISEYNYLAKEIAGAESQMEKLIQSNKEYERIVEDIKSGKGGHITVNQQEKYKENIKTIESIQLQISALRQKQQVIIDNNKAIQEQIEFQKKLRSYTEDKGSISELRKNDELRKMNEYYKELEKTSKKAADESAKAAKREAKERDKAAKAAEMQAKVSAKLAEQQAKQEIFRKNTTFEGSMDFSASTKSINEQVQAIKYLQIARANLSKENISEEEYRRKIQQLTQEIRRQQKDVDKLVGKNSQLQKSHSKLMDTMGQLSRKFALIFSVSQISNYIQNLARVRGEFELQQKSLQVLLQNKDEADKLWQQTLDLAVKSPFRVGELVSYTRQLAAYRIETDKLHETTRKLADVSAGLGVDMNRLILAYGQVRAAEYLRGTELRQFTEAGIPMLDELAKRFTALEGRMVSAGDVFERISKRMVSFKDVSAVFDSMTSASGTFYRMQEQQSSTLAGMISNLHDSIDIMLNDIGKSNEGILKGAVNTAKTVVENWREIAFILEKIVYLMVPTKLAMMAYTLGTKNAGNTTLWWNEALKAKIGTTMADVRTMTMQEAKIYGLSRAQYAAGKATMYLQGALRGVGVALKAMAIPAIIGLILELYRRVTEASRAAEELEKNLSNLLNEDTSKIQEQSDNYKSLVTQLRNANEASQERRNIVEKLNSQYGEYLNFIVNENTSINDLANSYDEVIKRMKEKAALSTMEKGLNVIAESYGKKLTEAENNFKDLFRGASIKKDKDTFGFIIPTEDDIDNIMSILQSKIREMNADQMDSLDEQQKIIQNIIKEYYGEEFFLSRDYSKSIELIDILIKKKEEEEKLEKRINTQYKETLKSREANIAFDKLQNEYKKKQIEINKEANLTDFEVRQKLEKAKEQYELDKIELKLTFGEISENEARLAKERILNWATDTVKDVNEKLRLDKELFGFTEEQMSTIIISQEEQNKGMAAIIKNTIDGWKNANDVIAEQISLKSAGLRIDEKMLEKYQAQEKLYRRRAEALGIELKYVTKINEATLKSINERVTEKYRLSLEDSYKSINDLMGEYTAKENEALTLLQRIYIQAKEKLTIDYEQVNTLKEQIANYREIRKLLGEAIDPAISESSKNAINALLPEEYQISFIESLKSVTELQNDANQKRKAAIELEKTYQQQISQGIPVEDELMKKAKDDIEFYTKKWKLLGGIEEEKKTGAGHTNSLYDERIKIIDDMNKKYKEINRTLGDTEALQGAFDAYIDAFAKAFEEISWIPKNVSQMTPQEFASQVLNFPNEDALVAFLDKLAKEPMKAFEQIKVELAKGKYTYELKVNAKIIDDKALKKQIEDLFDKYELSLELDKLNIPTNLAKSLFDIEAVDLGGLKKKLEELKPQFVGAEMEEQYRQYLEKVSDMEDKARIENLKKYTQYLIAAQSEAVKIKLEEVRKIAEIEKLNMTPAQKEIAKTAVRQETQKKLDVNAWNQFKESDTYIEMFDNLENVSKRALESMRNKLIEMRKELKNLDPKDLKEIQARFNKIEEALVKKDPFKNLTSNFKKAINAMKGYEKAQDKVYKAEIDVSNQQETVDNLTMQVEEQKKLVAENGANAEIDKYNLVLLEDKLKLATLLLEKSKAGLDNAVQEKEAQKQILSISKERLKESANSLSEGYNAFTGLTDTIQDIFGEFSSDTQDFLENVGAVVGGVVDVENGLSEILDGKVITGALHAATGVFKAIGGLFGFGNKDKKKERQIQHEIKFVEDLQRAYEKLEKAIDDAYSIDTLQKTTKNAKENINAQIVSYQKMIAAEEAKKKTDQDRIKEWQNAIEDLQEQMEELNKQTFSQVTDGIIDNMLDAARQVTDAWLESFNEVGDGLTGLEDNFKESLKAMLKQQASMLITQAYVEQWKKELQKYISPEKEDLQLTVDEAKNWVQSVTSTLPQLNEALTNYFEAFKQAGVDLGESESKLSGLQRGIQELQESTGQEIAAYANSCRFFLANIDTTLTSVANQILGGENMPNPILSELRTQTELVRGISTLLNSVVRGSHSMGGQGIKVFIS